MSELFPMDPADLAAAIDIPLSEWPGNCHGVAEAIRDLVPVQGMRIARGHWTGHVSRKSVYRKAPIQHSWLVAPDGRILDPTRWAIVSPSEPSIYLGPCDDYDEGGRTMASRRYPSLPTGDDPYARLVGRMEERDRTELASALDAGSTDPGRLGDTLTYALRDDPDRLPDAASAFVVLQRTGNKAVVPIDSWMRVMEPEKLLCRPGSNRTFELPPAPAIGDARILFEIFNRFLCIEERDDIERELEEFGYDLQRDLWTSLNRLEMFSDLPISVLPRETCDTISVVAAELLGKGFGEVLRVERYASSIGAPPRRLKALMAEFGMRSGFNLDWDVPADRHRAPEIEDEAPVGLRF